MRFIRLCLLLLLLITFITSCKKAVPKQTKYISKSAVLVATINTTSLQAKLAKNQATIENIVRSISGSDSSIDKGKQEWEDIKASGIDMDENFYVAVVNKGGDGLTGNGKVVTSIIGALEDGGKLEAYIKKKNPGGEVSKEKAYSYSTFRGDNVIAWNKEVVIMLLYQKTFSANDMQYDSTTRSFNLGKSPNAANDKKAEFESVFNLKEDQSVASIPEFRDLMQEKSDASMWVNSTASMGNLPIPLPRVQQLFANSFTAAKINFDDGKITMNSRSYYSKELRNILKNYSGPVANLGLIENYPSNNINAFGVFSFNPEFFNGLVQYLEVGGVVDGYLSRIMGTNYTLSDALKAIKGDFAVIVSDFATSNGSDTATVINKSSFPNLKMILNIPVGDRLQMNRLMDKLAQMQLVVKSNNQYTLSRNLQSTGYQLIVDDKNIFIASDENLLNQYKTGSKKPNFDRDLMNDFKGKSGVAYINIESILNGIQTGVDEQGSNVLPKAKETFKELRMYTNNFNGKFVEGHGELRFKNEKENSLTSLLGFIETASKSMKKVPAVNNGMNRKITIDTVRIPEPLKAM